MGTLVEIKNPYGRVKVQTEDDRTGQASVSAEFSNNSSESDLRIDWSGSKLKIAVRPLRSEARIDLTVMLPVRARVRVKTSAGEVHVLGDFADARVITETGTIYADVSLEYLMYRFVWTGSKPRVISEVDLTKVRERAAGRFEIRGFLNEQKKEPPKTDEQNDSDDLGSKTEAGSTAVGGGPINLYFTTLRGIILLNVSPNEVPSTLRERPLTEAAKAIVRSGDSLLVNAIRRSSPKHFGEYAATLPPRMATPTLGKTAKRNFGEIAPVKRVMVQVTDINNRAVQGLNKQDFILTEHGNEREIISVKKTVAPFNLVLLLDVSGSIEHYVDFIRKAARNFIYTASPQDKIAIVIFNEDVKTLSGLTKDRQTLSESLDTFDAGGGTAYYDSLAYSLTETLRPLKGDRTAIVVLSDGDDNRSFLPFNSLLGSIQESGALIYPLYVPSGLIAASATSDPNKTVDTLRARFMGLTSKAQKEGEILARVSGGVYYPISRLSELQKAYDDIVLQLRTAYTITFRSDSAEPSADRTSPRLKVKVKRDATFVKMGPIITVDEKDVSVVTRRYRQAIQVVR